ncbi:MAG: ribonuclease P protein component [Woeseiaceae bacterium]|nr:ribonuclease P protein component [Woeseiaceae bacterium]
MQPRRPFRFSKDNRLPDAASFDRVFEKARRSGDRWFTVLSRSNDLQRARLGLAISKKHCKRAVARNRLKRIVRESFRQHLRELDGLDIVVMNRAAACDAASKELFASLEQHWLKRMKKTAAGN